MNKFFCLAKNILKSNFADLAYPYRMTYILTYKCQFRCGMCNIWQRPQEEELTLEQVKEFFQKYNSFSWINLSGGEVFLRADFIEIVKVIFEKCRCLFLLDFPTNGFQTEVIVKNVGTILRDYSFPKLVVTVSLDGPPHLHDKIRNIKGSWDKAVETFSQLRPLRCSKFYVFLGMTLQPDNTDKFFETFHSVNDKIGGMRYNDFHLNIVQHSAHYYGNSQILGIEDKRSLWAQIDLITKNREESLLDPVRFLERRYQRFAKKYLDRNKTPVTCQALSASFFMSPSGDIYPCSIYDKLIGNIRDYGYSIYKIWDNDYRRSLREEISNGNCPNCWTPCEAYQSILANLLPGINRKKKR